MNSSKNSSNEFHGKSGNTRQISPALWWCFTVNNYTKDDINDILNICSSNSSIKFIFQEELGDEGTPHLQGTIRFHKKVRPIGMFKNKTIHWEKTKKPEQSILYCCKEETRNGELWTNIEVPEPLDILDPSTFYNWQKDIHNILLEKPNKRTIHWIWETNGGVGKSEFAKYLCATMNAIILSGKNADMKFGIMNYAKYNRNIFPKIIIIDVPRPGMNYVSYVGIEEVKNGCFFSSKYEGSMCLFNSPHIVVFANEPPMYHKMSNDRWKVFEIIDGSLSPTPALQTGETCAADNDI